MIRWPRPISTLRFLAAWLTPWKPAFRARASRSGLSFYLHHRDMLGRHVAKYGTYETELTEWIARHLADGPTGLYVDVGANLGWHVVHAARQARVETIVAFEPDPFNAWLLSRNLALNDIQNTVICQSAVGETAGVARLHSYKASNCGRHSLLADYGNGSLKVPLTDLDGALARLGLADRRVALIKIDVEGYEPAVIAGAQRTLARCDAVVLEFSPQLAAGGPVPIRHMVESLIDNGFQPFRLAGGGTPVAIGREDLDAVQGQLDVIWLRPRSSRPAA